MLIAVPPTTWSTLLRIESPARSRANRAPMAMPASNPAYWFDAALPTMAPAKAPASSMPSIAMFTTPDRSHRTPARRRRSAATPAGGCR